MIIESIESFYKQNYKVSLSNYDELCVHKKHLTECKLNEQKVLSEEEYAYLVEHVVYPYARHLAFNYLSYRNRTSHEVVMYLEKQGFHEKRIALVMAFLHQYNYVDDYGYAKRFIESHKDLGSRGLSYKLRLKKIPDDIISELLEEGQDREEENCYNLLMKRMKSKPLDSVTKNKQMNYLVRKGFKYPVIYKAIRRYQEENDSE